MRKINFKYKIFIYFTIAAILPCFLFWMFIYQRIDRKLVHDYKNVSYEHVVDNIEKVDDFFQRQSKVVNSIAQAYAYVDKSPEALKAFVMKQTVINDDFLNLYIIKSTGELISSNGDILTDNNYTNLSTYVKASRMGSVLWLEPYKDSLSGLNTIGISAPLFSKDGQLDGVVVANLDNDFFEKTIEDVEHFSDSDIFLIDSAGDIKFSLNTDFSKYKNINDNGFILKDISTEILNSKVGNRSIEQNGNTLLCTYIAMKTGGWKVVAVSDVQGVMSNVSLMNKRMYSSITIFGFFILLLIGILSYFMSNSISGPLLMLRDGVKELALGNLEHTITVESNDEIEEVADTFNQMSYNLKRSYEDLFRRTEELYEKNENLQEMNAELEASYEQLGATMEQLNDSEEKYRKLVNNISDMVLVLNNNAEIVYVNTAVQNILNQSESQLIGKNLREILGTDLNEDTLAQCYVNDKYEFELRLTNYGAKILYFEGSTRRVIENGNMVGIQAIVRDITQRKMMEERLRVKYNELQAINEVTNAVTRTLDLDEVMEIVAEKVTTATEGLCCIVGLYDNDGFVLKAVNGIKLYDKSLVNVDSTKDRTVQLIGNQRYFIMESKSEAELPSEYFKMLYREDGYRYTLFNPIIAHGRHIGLISTLFRNKPSQEMIDLVSSMSNNIALSIDNAKAYESVKAAYLKTVQSLVSAIEAKDIYTESHSVRVAKYATLIASEMNLDKSIVEDIWVAGVLHDIGKIGISDSILNKTDRLTQEEYDLIKQHPSIAYKILSNIGLDSSIMYAVRHHHERYDGMGYPDGLAGIDINLMASIISVADAFDAMTSERSYREPRSIEEGINELQLCKGTQFNPDVIDIFQKTYEVKPELLHKIHRDEDVKFF